MPLDPIYFSRIKNSIQPYFLQSLVIDINSLWILMLGAFIFTCLIGFIILELSRIKYFYLSFIISTCILSIGLGLTSLIYSTVSYLKVD